ncbi:MAG: hypothetical protein M3279_12955 [Actinomycetota bacterium]|nr:hypothetical protein [Actinomycetota bacterium]
MRKFLGLCAIVFVLLAAAPAALAQSDTGVRDPFVPLIAPSPVATEGTDPAVPTDPTVPVDPVPDPNEPLPGTGSSASPWVGLGYVLIALGAGAVVLSKVLGPVRLTARHTRRAIRGIPAPLP